MDSSETQGSFLAMESSPEASPVKTYRSQGGALVWLVDGVACSGKLCDWLLSSNLVGSSWRTSLASCRQTEDATWESSSGRWENSGMGSPTECWTLSTSEWPNDGDVCSLSDVLETTGAHLAKYWLSAKACAGILRRAERRGKSLPAMLDQALRTRSTQGDATT